MTDFSCLLLVVLFLLVLAVLLGAWELRRTAVAVEAMAEALGTLADSVLVEAESEARETMAERLGLEAEEKTKPDHPSVVEWCHGCGRMKQLCSCHQVL